MNRFKVGDKVKRTRSEHEGMKVGDIGVVKSFENSMNMYLEGYNFAHDPENFELVVEDEKEITAKWLKENKWFTRTGNPEKSVQIQKWLFEHGIDWAGNPKDSFSIYGTQHQMLTNTCGGQATGTIMWSVDHDDTTSVAKEITLEFETVVKSVTLPTIESEKDKKIRELQETIQSAANQIKAIKEGM